MAAADSEPGRKMMDSFGLTEKPLNHEQVTKDYAVLKGIIIPLVRRRHHTRIGRAWLRSSSYPARGLEAGAGAMSRRIFKLAAYSDRGDLTGLGERAHLLRPDIGLDTHVADIMGLLHHQDLNDVTLVGHSYGGTVITAVAERGPTAFAPRLSRRGRAARRRIEQ